MDWQRIRSRYVTTALITFNTLQLLLLINAVLAGALPLPGRSIRDGHAEDVRGRRSFAAIVCGR